MTRSEQVFLLILILNTMVAIGYLIRCMVRNGWKAPRRKEYWIKTIVMIICPLVGPAFFFAVWFVYYLLFHQDVDLEDVVFSKERVETHLKSRKAIWSRSRKRLLSVTRIILERL